jgi:transcriptional regulator with XRE-family HTH domain
MLPSLTIHLLHATDVAGAVSTPSPLLHGRVHRTPTASAPGGSCKCHSLHTCGDLHVLRGRTYTPERMTAGSFLPIDGSSPEPVGQVVRGLRRRLGLSQDDLAGLLGCSRRWIIDLEQGLIVDLRLSDCQGLAAALQVDKDRIVNSALATASAMLEARGQSGQKRPYAGRIAPTMSMQSAVLLNEAPSVGPVAVSNLSPRHVDPETPAQLEALLNEYVRIDNRLGPAHLVSLMDVHLHHISELVSVASDSIRPDLLTVRARYAEFAGWLQQDAGNLVAAKYWTTRALDWARAANNPVVTSYILMRLSNQGSESGDTRSALGLANASLRYREQLSGPTRALAHRQQARAYALAQDEVACARALESTIEAVTSPGDNYDEQRTLSGYCTVRYVRSDAADCWTLLGKPRRAVPILEEILAQWPLEHQRECGLATVRLAIAHAANDEPEQACLAAQLAVAILQTSRSARAIAQLRRLPALLAEWQDMPCVIHLHEALASL